MNAALAQEVGRLTRELNQFKAQYLGTGQRPQSGCRFSTVSAEESEVLVEYEFTPAEEARYDADKPGVGPGHDAELTVIQALINGQWIDPRKVFAESVVERWEERLMEEQMEVA